MKTRNLISLFAIVIAIAFASTNLFAQEDGKKENKNEGLENLDNKGTADTVRTQLNNAGLDTENQVRVRVNEGQGAILYGEALKGEGKASDNKSFVDEDGDGINDNAINSDGDGTALKQATKKEGNKFDGNKYGPGDGMGNDGIGHKDGTGYGPGDCTTPAASGTKRGTRK